jgi:hypothetical protein
MNKNIEEELRKQIRERIFEIGGRFTWKKWAEFKKLLTEYATIKETGLIDELEKKDRKLAMLKAYITKELARPPRTKRINDIMEAAAKGENMRIKGIMGKYIPKTKAGFQEIKSLKKYLFYE